MLNSAGALNSAGKLGWHIPALPGSPHCSWPVQARAHTEAYACSEDVLALGKIDAEDAVVLKHSSGTNLNILAKRKKALDKQLSLSNLPSGKTSTSQSTGIVPGTINNERATTEVALLGQNVFGTTALLHPKSSEFHSFFALFFWVPT